MYRDDLEAAQASIRTLEASLEAEQQRRLAAEAATRAADAARDEALISAKRRGVNGATPIQRHWMSLIVLCIGTMILGFLWIGSRSERARSNMQLRRMNYEVDKMRQQNAVASRQIKQLSARVAWARSQSKGVEATPPAPKAPLTRTQIQSTMRSIKPDVQACYDKFRVPGLMSVRIKLDNSGDVTSARIRGVFAGTPTGACARKVITSAKFPASGGSATTFIYPFVLR